jgi:hypothetical protein
MRKHLPQLWLLIPVLAFAFLSCDGYGGEDAPPAQTTPLPAPLPAVLPDHLSLGLMNGPSQLAWMTESGVPWDYRYQYLTGGVNTDAGWMHWRDPPGSFVDVYLQDSRENGYIPVLTYYQVVPSTPEPMSEEVALKLRDASTMRAYFEEWALLMERAGASGGPVIVHVEPDIWGYAQQEGDDPGGYEVAVASTGLEELSDLPDSLAGFAQGLVRLRDRLAPNVLLGFHVSSWATGRDLILSGADPVETADRIAAFYRSLGAEFDLLFFGPADRDAAYMEAKTGKRDYWWEEDDFERYRVFMARMVSDTGRRAVLWQVPVGNTLYRSMDNSPGHYQDNRAQYWLGDRRRLEEYVDAGVIAILFGAGADGCTMYTDGMGDGVTDPPPVNGNERETSYADDDGGYLRLAATEYYRSHLLPLPSFLP